MKVHSTNAPSQPLQWKMCPMAFLCRVLSKLRRQLGEDKKKARKVKIVTANWTREDWVQYQYLAQNRYFNEVKQSKWSIYNRGTKSLVVGKLLHYGCRSISKSKFRSDIF